MCKTATTGLSSDLKIVKFDACISYVSLLRTLIWPKFVALSLLFSTYMHNTQDTESQKCAYTGSGSLLYFIQMKHKADIFAIVIMYAFIDMDACQNTKTLLNWRTSFWNSNNVYQSNMLLTTDAFHT